MNSLPQVDIWLSTRLNKYENRTFKYYSEFRFKTDQSDADFLNQINKNEIRLEVLRREIRKEGISYGELIELQSYAEHIDKNDVELSKWASKYNISHRMLNILTGKYLNFENTLEECIYKLQYDISRHAF